MTLHNSTKPPSNLPLLHMNRSFPSFGGHVKRRAGTERGSRAGATGFHLFSLSAPVVHPLSLFSWVFLSRLQDLSFFFGEERQILQGSVNHYPLLTSWHWETNRLSAGNIDVCMCMCVCVRKGDLNQHFYTLSCLFLHSVFICVFSSTRHEHGSLRLHIVSPYAWS